MALTKVHTNKGNGSKGKSRWTYRSEVKQAAKKARRAEGKKATA
jgi:hypothetical protein